MSGNHKDERVEGLDLLRGVASLAVCLCHLATFNDFPTPPGDLYRALQGSLRYGWLGVEAFFVISGFVIPYSLYRSSYRLGAYPRFILKRLIRLDPPYLVAMLLIISLAYAYAVYGGREFAVQGEPVTWSRVLLHLGYVNAFVGRAWFDPVFWTLAVEFQYYVLVGLAFPLFGGRRAWVRLAALALFVAPGFFTEFHTLPTGGPHAHLIFPFAPLFALGIGTFQRWVGLSGRAEYAAVLVLAAAAAWVTGVAPAAVGLASVAGIHLWRRRTAVTSFFGNISYSLYLLHWTVSQYTMSIVGVKILRADTDAEKALVFLLALAACVAAAYLLYATVERPAQRWSSRIRYGRHPRPEETSGLAPAVPSPVEAK
jgi:peptidoglycan/LPS O-acetylase OafA/YrhL